MNKRLRKKKATTLRKRSLDALWVRALREPDPQRRYAMKSQVHTLRRRRCPPPILMRDDLRLPGAERLVTDFAPTKTSWVIDQQLADLRRAYPALSLPGEPERWRRVPARQHVMAGA